jgi:hypothetical protein
MRLAALFQILSLPCLALTIHVPADQPTIQAGINAASSEDTVLVTCGTYYEWDISIDQDVVLVSESEDPSCVVIDAMENGKAFWISNSSVYIEGITIENGNGGSDPPENEGGGIRCINSSLRMRNCIIQDCVCWSINLGYTGWGGAIYVENGDVNLEDCKFLRNEAGRTGYSGTGGGLLLVETQATLVRCDFIENRAHGHAGAIDLLHGGLVTSNCNFIGNLAIEEPGGNVGAISASYCDPFIVDQSNFIDNRAAWHSGAIEFARCNTPMILNSHFAGNQAGLNGGSISIAASAGSTPIISNTTFVSSQATEGSCLFVRAGVDVVIEGSILSSSSPGVAIDCAEAGTSLYVSCSDFFGNIGGDISEDFLVTLGDDVLYQDPLFCDPDIGDFTLRNDSPCAPNNNDCGVLMGAWPVGCSTSAQSTTWSELKLAY